MSVSQQRSRLKYTVQPVRHSVADRNASHTLPSACIAAWVNTGANGVNQEIIATWHDSGGSVRSGNGIDKKWKFRLHVNMAISAAPHRHKRSERELTPLKLIVMWKERRHGSIPALWPWENEVLWNVSLYTYYWSGCKASYGANFTSSMSEEILLSLVNELAINTKRRLFLTSTPLLRNRVPKLWIFGTQPFVMTRALVPPETE